MKRISVQTFFLALLFNLSVVTATERFVIEDIQIEGLQRLTPGTIFNYLPVKIGDRFDELTSTEAVRALFSTGFFDDIKLQRDGNILVIIIKERPTIGSIEISGNKDIKTENLLEGLEEVGFARGRVFDQSQLDKLERELQRQYFSNGKYGVSIKSTVDALANNRVAVSVQIAEGDAARIRQINVVGNKAFREKDLLGEFELGASTLFSFFTKNDRYSRQKLSGDLEKLQSFYQNQGYINFSIDSTQVTITPDKQDIYITINITEGEQHRVANVKLAGEFIVPEEDLFRRVLVKSGDLFSRKALTDTSTLITDRLGMEGYAFANVNAIPEINDEKKTVDVTFFVDPGKHVYVRRISFSGHNKTRDEVLRREMRQQEGGWISTPLVERGKLRLQRLGYFDEVDVETPAVPGSADQVDVHYTVKERPFGNFLAGLGFSQTDGLIISTSIAQDNFLGSGTRMQFSFNNSSFNRVFSLGYVNPYYTDEGISRGFNFSFQETRARRANLTAFDSRIFSTGVNFGIPIAEFNSISLAAGYENTRLSEDGFFAIQVRDFINREGNEFDLVRLSAGFAYDTRNREFMPTRGTLHRIVGEVAVPSFGNSLAFYKINYRSQWFRPLFRGFILSLRADLGFGDGFGGKDLPFFENFYSGGPRSVRGFEENTLGPKDNFGNPLGGNVQVIGGAEVIIPMPFLDKFQQVRFSAFLDAGNVYCTSDQLNSIDGTPLCKDEDRFDLGNIRYSTGFGGVWISPFGVISVSIAKTLNDKPGDDTQVFQFNFGTNF